MRRGEVYVGRLDPVEGSEQAGARPVVIVSRDAINDTRRVVVAVPFTTDRGRDLVPSQVRIIVPDGGLRVDSVALCEQVRAIAKTRLDRPLGVLSPASMERIDRAHRVALNLD